MVIDSHTHVEGLPGCPWQDPPELMVRLMDEAGIDRAVVMTYVDAPWTGGDYDPLTYVEDACRRHPDRLWGYARLDPGAGRVAVELLRSAVRDRGFMGLKLHPYGYRALPDSPATLALIREAAALRVPVLFHCGDEECTLPLQCARAAAAVPEATVILGHMGGYFHVDEAIAVARQLPNIVLETSAMPYPAKIREAVEAVGAQRVLFASDGPGCDPLVELRKVGRARLGKKAERLVLGENFLRILGRRSR